jgi:hypothetical protein
MTRHEQLRLTTLWTGKGLSFDVVLCKSDRPGPILDRPQRSDLARHILLNSGVDIFAKTRAEREKQDAELEFLNAQLALAEKERIARERAEAKVAEQKTKREAQLSELRSYAEQMALFGSDGATESYLVRPPSRLGEAQQSKTNNPDRARPRSRSSSRASSRPPSSQGARQGSPRRGSRSSSPRNVG